MKKIRNVLLSMAMIFIVVLSTACSSKEAATATKTYVLEKNGLKTTIVYTYIEKEDKVVKQTTKNEGIYAQLPSTKTKEEAQKVLDPIAKKYQGIKGIKHSIDYQEDKTKNFEVLENAYFPTLFYCLNCFKKLKNV